MSPTPLIPIHHDSAIFALAVAGHEKWVACGGGSKPSVTLWDLASGALIHRLEGMTGQVHTLAFAADSARLAAADVWGGVWVWQTNDGRLIQHKKPTTARRRRTLFFPPQASPTALPRLLSDSINHGPLRAVAPDGQWLASAAGNLTLTPYQHHHGEPLALDYLNYAVAPTGIRALRWSADSQAVGMAGDGWAGIWRPFEGQFFGRALAAAPFIYDISVLGTTMQLLCAMGQNPTPTLLDMPPQPLPTRWQAQFQQLAALASAATTRTDWNWNVTQWGYDGVRLQAEELLWYSHSHNSMDGGGGAIAQSLPDFVAQGTRFPIPEELLAEVCRAVQQRMAEKK